MLIDEFTRKELANEFAIPVNELNIYSVDDKKYILSDFGIGVLFNIRQNKKLSYPKDEVKEEQFKLAIASGRNALANILQQRLNPATGLYTLEHVYDTSFDTNFKHWVRQMMPYCSKNAICFLSNKKITSEIDHAIIVRYNKEGKVLFYGEYYGEV